MQLFCAPQYPDKESYALAVIMHHLEYTVTLSADRPFDAGVLWEDKTFLEVPDILRAVAEYKPVLNIDCVDISKRRVERALNDIFGLSTLVDPTTYKGKCVKKPDENAVRMGLVVDCPRTAEDGWVYQKLIEARVDGLQVEYRTPVILGEIPLVYVSQREYPTGDIRECKRHKLTPTVTEDVYNPEEINRILAFSKEIGMDVGELDVMRSTDDGMVYIIDANKTASGFGLQNRANWSPGDRQRVKPILAEVFERNLKTLIGNYRP